jgi:hypothetical protein
MTTPKKNDPLTVEEMTAAADIFMPLYKVVADQLPKATVEDVLKVMESVAKLGHKRRADKLLEEKSIAFGFNKDKEDADE